MTHPRPFDAVACLALPYLASLGGMVVALSAAIALAAALTGHPVR